ncbi:hypothetical protein P3T27_007674 [Kitasatospora sp. MAA19]|uniref:hypothetical protein n=1 Tax=unclassified Kitasatospora TaxID=2633591 RepID=UPI0024770A78|nr:hypothetical protein [Kitasatospora sp. MAA19]MDH6710923.1 hypothetical protein [Kitasatospora sp. MAA19]
MAALLRRLRILGAARIRTALTVAALAATATVFVASLPAQAEPAPTPAPSQPAGPTPQETQWLQDLLREQSEKVTPAEQEARLAKETEQLRKLLPDEGGLLGVFNVTDRAGLPISAYTVRSDTGGVLDWDLGIENLLTELCFMVTKWLIAFCCWLISWALSFGLAKLLLKPALAVAGSVHARIIVEMGLPSLFLAVCALICAARIFFGDKARGWGDAAVSILLAALTTTLLASPPQALLGEDHGAIAAARGLSLEIAGIILQADPGGPRPEGDATRFTLSRPLTDALTDAFVVKPAMLLQYGRVFDGPCAGEYAHARIEQLTFERAAAQRTAAIKKTVSSTLNYLPGGSYLANTSYISQFTDPPIDMALQWAISHYGTPPMDKFEKKCVPGDVTAAKQASLDKVGGALFLLVAAAIVTVLICALAGSFLVAQCRIAWDAVRGEPALVVGTIPGAGRGFLWDWCASVLRSLGQLIASIIALAVFIVVLQAVLDPAQSDWGNELTLRFLAVDVVCIAAVRKRRQITTRSRQVATAWRQKMSAARVGGTHGSVFSPPPTPAAKPRQAARTTARVLVRTALAGAALAQGNPLAAAGYAMPQSIGATALMSRLATSQRSARPRPGARPTRPARPAGRPQGPKPPAPLPPAPPNSTSAANNGAPAPAASPPATATAPRPATVRPPRPPHPKRPTTPPRPATAPATPQRAAPPTPRPAASAHQHRLRQRLNRATRPTPPRRRP